METTKHSQVIFLQPEDSLLQGKQAIEFLVSNNIAKTNQEASNIIQELIANSEILSKTNQFSENATLSFKKPRKVVIIGGGFAGAALAKRLPSHQFEVLIVTQTDSFSFLPRLPAIIRDPQYISKVDVKYKEVNACMQQLII